MDQPTTRSAVTTATLLIVVFLIYRYILYPLVFSPLAKIPSAHWSCSVSSAWVLRARFYGQENKTLYKAHQEHGPIVRLAPFEVSLNDMSAVKTVYRGGFDKHEWYSIFNNYGVPCTFSSHEARYHSLRKRMVSNVYSKSYIHSSASLAAQSNELLNARLLPLLEKSTHKKQEPHGIDVHSLFAGVAMDFISAYCFGIRHSSNFIQHKLYRDHWLELYRVRKGYGFFDQEMPQLSRALRAVRLDLTPSWVSTANRELEAWCKQHCKSALLFLDDDKPKSQGTAEDPVVLRSLLAGIEKEESTNGAASLLHSTAIQQRELSIASEVFDHILAGQETTGVALTYVSWHLSRSQDLQRQLRTELLTLKPDMRLQDGRTRVPDPKQLDSLPILQAVTMETIRRYAPAGGPEPRVTPSPSCRLGPYEVPGGVRVSASVYNLHRDEVNFPDPETWDHTRWLPDAEDNVEKSRDRYRQFWGFSSGGRMCLGSNFATHEMKLVIAAIYSNYTSYIVNDEGIEPTDGYTAHPASGQLWLRFDKTA